MTLLWASEFMDVQTLSKYLNLFGRLHRNKGMAPHKPVLLVSILDEIERGHIADNQIVLTVDLVAAFRENWHILPLPPGNWVERIWLPFRYLLQDGFWQLIKDGEALSGKEVGDPHSVNDLSRRVNYAKFTPELWELVQEKTARKVLRQHLLEVYFHIGPSQVQPYVPADPLQSQLEKLIQEAQSKPRPKKVKESIDGTEYYIRHALFPQIIRGVYDEQCAVCGLTARTEKSTIIEAAHIKPFADFHDDHPSNGLALCKNHHWGFDAGGFSISDDYTIMVSSHFTYSASYITSGTSIYLPSSENCYPSQSSLAYHRETRLIK
jgi:putative restriction endonuclease